jgi:hypothetical protein
VPKFGTIGKLDQGRSGTWHKHHWHSLGAHRWPVEQQHFEGDLRRLVEEFVLPGHVPAEPMLQPGDSVVTLGSCFARELRKYLAAAGFASDNFWIPSALNNTYALVDFVSWCVTGSETSRGYRYDRTEAGEIRDWTPEEERERILGYLRDAGAFVFTLGLAEFWQDSETGGVFWRGIPRELFDPERHVFRLSTVEENERNLLELIGLLRQANPTAPIVLTVSPVPAMATFRDMSCVTADCVSKSTLRVALDRALATGPENVYYFPSFEVVRWLGGHYPFGAYGIDDGVSRHASKELVALVIETFVEHFFTPEAVAAISAANPSPQ